MPGFKRPYLSPCFLLFVYLNLPDFISPAVLYSLDTYCSMGPEQVQFGTTGANSYGIVSVSKNGSYFPGLNCNLTLDAPHPGYQLHLAFSEIFTRDCSLDHVMVKLENGESHQLCGYRSCPSEDCADLEFDSASITLQFMSSSSGSINKTLIGFRGMVTVFSTADGHGNCHTTEQYRCKNRHCIWKGLYCNQHNHCGDKSDEPLGCTPFAKQAIWGVLVIIFGAASFCIFLPLFCYFAMRGQRSLITRHSAYQPLPTSINDRETTHYTAALVYPASGYYGTGLNSDSYTNSTDVAVHSKAVDGNQDSKTYH